MYNGALVAWSNLGNIDDTTTECTWTLDTLLTDAGNYSIKQIAYFDDDGSHLSTIDECLIIDPADFQGSASIADSLAWYLSVLGQRHPMDSAYMDSIVNAIIDENKLNFRASGGYGTLPCTLFAMNTAGGVIGNLPITIRYASTGEATGSSPVTTGSDGYGYVSLDSNLYYVYANDPDWTITTPACTLNFSDNATGIKDTLWGTAYDYGTGAVGDVCNTYVIVRNNSGTLMSGVEFTARLNRARVQYGDQWLVGYEVSDTTNASGVAILPLIVNNSLSPAGTKYIFTLTDSLGTIIGNVSAEVPDSLAGSSWELER